MYGRSLLDDVGMNLIQVQRSQWILDGYNNMTESELKSLLSTSFPKENESCEWKEFKNLKNFSAVMKGMILFLMSLACPIWKAGLLSLE